MKKYCKSCEQEVKGNKKFSWVIFILGFLTFGILSALYVIYYLIFKRSNKCPICGTKTMSLRKHKRQEQKNENI